MKPARSPEDARPAGRKPAAAPMREIHYRSRQRVSGRFPGAHPSRQGETGFEFRTHASLMDAPDARRLDLHASLRDPFGQWQVRLHAQRMAMAVYVVADLSASMTFRGKHDKLATLAELTQSLAWSAERCGDGFGFVGCDAGIRPDFLQPLSRQRGAGWALGARLAQAQSDATAARSAQGLLMAHRHLRHRRALVFVVSDFHLPIALIDTVFRSLNHHEIVPIVLWDPAEFEAPVTRWGHALVPLYDPETRQEQLVWWRPALKARWEQAQQQRQQDLQAVMRKHRLNPVVLMDGFDADRISRHFHA